MTPRTICTLALKISGALGVGQTPLAEDINDAFTMLNMMIGQWAQKRWLVYHLIDVSIRSTGAASYTIGVGGAINTPRPDRIESAFVRLLSRGQGVDYPLDIIESREDWNLIPLKGISGFPSAIFYDSGFPLGIVYVQPVPSAQYELHLSVKQPISAFANLSDDVALPDEYHEALLYNLTGRLFAPYGLPVRSDVVALARGSLNTIRNSNTQIANLRMPSALPGRRWAGIGAYGAVAYTSGPSVVVPPTGGASSVFGEGVLGQMVLGSGSSPASGVLGEGVLGQMVLGSGGSPASGVLGEGVLDQMALGH